MAKHNSSSTGSQLRPASGTVIKGEYPKGFVGEAPLSVLVYVNLRHPADERRAHKLLPDVGSRPINEEARRAIEAMRIAEFGAVGSRAVRPGVADTGVSPMSAAFAFGVPCFGFGSFYGKTLAKRGYRLTEAYLQEGGVTNGGKRRAPRLCLVFDGPKSFYDKLPTLPEGIRDQVADFLGEEAFTDGHVWDNTAAAAGTVVVNCCLTPANSERTIRFTDLWGVETVEL